MTLGQRIQQHRTELGLSQEGLGEKLGVSRQAVSKWEADGAVPDTDKLIALSKLFGITLNELLQVETPEQKEAEPKKKNDWKTRLQIFLAALCFLLGVFAYTFSMGRLLGKANDEIERLKWEVRQLETRLESLEAAQDWQRLDPAAPMVEDFEFQPVVRGDRCDLTLNLLPYQLPPGLEVEFTVSGPGEEWQTAQAHLENGRFMAEILSVKVGKFTIAAVFRDGDKEYIKNLVRITSMTENVYGWEPLWEAE